MPDQFSLGDKDLKQLKKFYKRAPKAFQRVSAGVLNSMAFGTRIESIKVLKNVTTVRTPSILERNMRVKMANGNQAVNQQFSTAGSITSARHDGWEAIEKGSATRLTLFSDEGRGGSKQNVSKRASRAIPAQHLGPDDFNLSDSTRDMEAYLQAIARDKRRRKAFYLPKNYKRMRPGVYKFKGGKVGAYTGKTGRKYKRTLVGAKIKRLSTPGEKRTMTRKRWMEKALKRSVSTRELNANWDSNFKRHLGKMFKF